MNHAKFFDHLRRSRLFGGALTQDEVDGVNAVLAEAATLHLPLPSVAYVLATAYGETGGTMQPRRENLYYTTAGRLRAVWPSTFAGRNALDPRPYLRNPRGLANLVYNGKLGNRPGSEDGWNFRGAGMGQITGRDNFEKFGRGIGVDLVARPERLMSLRVSARALVWGMAKGWATGKRLSDYLHRATPDYVGARRVWNGTFEAERYAGHARAFEAALLAGGYAPGQGVDIAAPEVPAKPDLSGFDRLRRAMIRRGWL